MFIKEFNPPATADRLLTGMTVWAADTTGVARLTIDTGKTNTKLNPVDIGSGGCGKTGQETKKETKGQLVELSMKSPVDLAAGQHIVWEHASLAFALAGALPANSVTCTCGTRTWATTLTKEGTDKRLRLTLPASGSTTTAVTCVAGDVVCKAREWSSSSTDVAEMTDATCFACDAAGSDCTKADSQAAVKGVVKHKSDVIFTFKQGGAKDTAVMTVKDVAYQPNSKTAVGRMYFKPSTSMSLYATSTIAYTFGAQTFGANAICQVFTSDGNKPSKVPSDIVSNCAISGSTVTLTMAKDSSANFHVQITGMDAWLASATNKVTGTVTNFGAAVQTTDSDATKQYAMAVVGTTTSASNEPVATTVVAVARTLVNVMDIGMIQFSITPKHADFGADGMAFISFPTYYNPTIGCMMRCSLYDTTAKADKERLYCKVAWDYTLMIMGPADVQKKDAIMVIRVYGVQMNLHSAAGNFGVGLTNSTYWGTHSHVVEFNTGADTATGVWGGVLPITVTSVALSSKAMRTSSDITVAFTLPETTGTVTAANDYVAMTLPYQWGGVWAWTDGTGSATAGLKLVTTTGTGTAAKTTKTAVKGAVVQLSGCTVVF